MCRLPCAARTRQHQRMPREESARAPSGIGGRDGCSGEASRCEEEFEFDSSDEWGAYVASEEKRMCSRRSWRRACPARAPQPHPVSAWSNGPPAKLFGKWVVDSGATTHLTCNTNLLKDVHSIKPLTVRVANKERVTLHEAGSVRMSGEGNRSVLLRDVASSPQLGTNLVSVSKLVDAGLQVTFTKKVAIVYERYRGARGTEKVVARAPRRGNLYIWPSTTRNYNKSMHTPTTGTQEHKHTA